MGSTPSKRRGSPSLVYTKEKVESDMKYIQKLPLARLQNGGIIQLEGVGGFFNPYQLEDISWAQGRFNQDDYVLLIQGLNSATADSLVGETVRYPKHEMAKREQKKAHAAMAYIKNVKQKWNREHGVYLTYKTGFETVSSDGHGKTIHKTACYLNIKIGGNVDEDKEKEAAPIPDNIYNNPKISDNVVKDKAKEASPIPDKISTNPTAYTTSENNINAKKHNDENDDKPPSYEEAIQ